MKIHGTAKGGALSKKDFGVAFGEAGGVDPVYEDGIGSDGDADLAGGFSLSESIYKLGTGSVGFKISGSDASATANGVTTTPAMTTTGTIACWFNVATGNSGKNLYAFGDTDASQYLSIRFFADASAGDCLDVKCKIPSGTTWQFFSSNDSISYNDSFTTWFHFALVQNGTEPKCYINGSEDTVDWQDESNKTKWVSDITGADNFTVGCRNNNNSGNTSFCKSYVDDFGIWNRALSSSEISSLGSGSGNLCSTITDGLRVYYNMDSIDDDKLVNQAIPP